jgi:hypothetical protein
LHPAPSPQAAPLIEIMDDFVPPELHAETWKACMEKRWYFGHGSNEGDAPRFWKLDLEGVPAFNSLWEHVRARCETLTGAHLRVIRQYANGHTYGLGGQPHLDDVRPGSYTLLYYPMQEWKEGWDGETIFYDEQGEIALAIRPRPNRAIFFDSRILHVGRPPSRSCPELRVTVAFKIEAVAADATPAVQEDASSLDVVETSRDAARRVYTIRIPACEVQAAAGQQLAKLAQTIRLPGFRPGKIPPAVLEQRYGASARAEAINRLVGEASAQALPKNSVPSQIELQSGADSGDIEFQLTVTYLPDLPEFDVAQVPIERLTAGESDFKAAGLTADEGNALLRSYVKRQVLDSLHDAYSFPLVPAGVDREFTEIWKAAEAQLDSGAANPQERESIAAELRAIAERRVRLGVVVAEMARRYNIRLTEEDLAKQKNTGETAAQARSRLMEDKVIDYLLGRAKVSERPATEADLRELLEE